MASPKMSLKLLIDKRENKVLFAEAGKDFVDFLFNLLSLPIGTVIRLLTKNGMVGCLGNLYESIENLSDTYLQPDQDKDVLLKPRAAISANDLSGLLLPENCNDKSSVNRKLYMCVNRCNYNVSDVNKIRRPQCSSFMGIEVRYVVQKAAKETSSVSGEGGFVKGVVTYMVMDDLVVQPMSTISSIALLNKFNVKEIGALQEKVVELGMSEGVELLKASLQSKKVLTSVFLKSM